jgi:hypothetical protein
MATFLTKPPAHKRFSYAQLKWRLRGDIALKLGRATLIAALLLVAGGQNRSLGEEAPNALDLKTQILALQEADEILLMILPYGMLPNDLITIEDLPKVASIYRIYNNESGKVRVISVLADKVLDGNKYRGELFPQIGILFKRHSEIIGQFYFSLFDENNVEDRGKIPSEDGEIPGRFNRRRVKLRKDSVNEIRALPASTNATVIQRR